MARRRDPQTGNLLPEGIHPMVSKRTGEVTYRARITHGPIGARRNLSRIEKTPERAYDWRLKTLMEINLGTSVEPRSITVEEFFHHWFRRKARDISGARAYTIRSAWDGFAAKRLADVRIQSVTRSMMQSLADQMEAEGLAPSSIHLYFIGLKEMFQSAINEEIIHKNPCDRISIAKADKPDKPIWSPLQLQKFLAAEKGSEFHPLWALMIGTCCRVGEAVALRWEDIDLEAGTAWFHRTVSKDTDGKLILVDRTKSGIEGRVITLERWVIDVLNTIPRTQDRVVQHIIDYKRIARVNRHLRRACERSSLPIITAHGLRHAAATAMALNGVEESIVQEILGHRSPATTKIYIHVNLAAKRKGTTSLAHILGQTNPDTTTFAPKVVQFETSASEVRQNGTDTGMK